MNNSVNLAEGGAENRRQQAAGRSLLTVSEAAQRCGVSRAHLYPYVMSGELGSMKLGRVRRIPVTALEDFIRRRVEEESHDEG